MGVGLLLEHARLGVAVNPVDSLALVLTHVSVSIETIWGEWAYCGLAYNLGRGLVWPVFMFPAFGQVVAGTIIVVVIAAVLVLN